MKSMKNVRWIIITVIFVIILVTIGMFLAASMVPGGYRPFRLNQQERKAMAVDFVNQHGTQVLSKIRVDQPFTHEMTEDQMNTYLASLEEIAFLKPKKRGELKKSGGVYEAMDKAGLADPMVTMDDGKLTFMVCEKESNKVISLIFKFDISDDKQLRVTLDGVKIGRLSIPRSMVEGTISAIQKSIGPKGEISETDVQNLDTMIAALISAVNDKPLPTVIKFKKDRIREIRDLKFNDGKMEITIVPVTAEDYAKMTADKEAPAAGTSN